MNNINRTAYPYTCLISYATPACFKFLEKLRARQSREFSLAGLGANFDLTDSGLCQRTVAAERNADAELRPEVDAIPRCRDRVDDLLFVSFETGTSEGKQACSQPLMSCFRARQI